MTCEDLDNARLKDKQLQFKNICGSSQFQVILFRPNEQMKASLRLCVCDKCKIEYGSCDLFLPYNLPMATLNKFSLRSDILDFDIDNDSNDDDCNDFLIPNSYCAVAADSNSPDTFWFFKIYKVVTATRYETDKYFHMVHPGQKYYDEFFLEEDYSNSKGKYF